MERFFQQLRDRIAEHEPFDLALLLTLFLIVVQPGPPWPWVLIIFTTPLALLGILSADLRRHPGFWFVTAAIFFSINNVAYWESSDNHKFLTSYWCLAIACSLCLEDRASALATSGHVLVGLVFGWATLWKATSLEYLNSNMFYFLLETDTRFFGLAHYFAGFEAESLLQNKETLGALGKLPEVSEPLVASAGMGWFSVFLTWYTLLIEGLLAVLFLIPKRNAFTRWRDEILLIFIVLTYPPTNVIHFGWILIAMAVAGCPPERKNTRVFYVVSFLFIFFFSTGQLRDVLFGVGVK